MLAALLAGQPREEEKAAARPWTSPAARGCAQTAAASSCTQLVSCPYFLFEVLEQTFRWNSENFPLFHLPQMTILMFHIYSFFIRSF